MKSEFISPVSHEPCTPLTSIKGYVDLVLDREAGAINDTQQEFLQVVRANSDRLIALINDPLDLSRIEAGRVTLNRISVDLAALVHEATVSMRTQLEANRAARPSRRAGRAARLS